MPLNLLSTGGGAITLRSSNTGTNYTHTIPAETGTVITSGATTRLIPAAAMPVGSIIQVVQVVKTDTFSSTAGGNSPADITGMSASITPSSSSSKIIVNINVGFVGASSDTPVAFFLYRNGTKIYYGDAAGVRPQSSAATAHPFSSGDWRGSSLSFKYIDSPASTSSVTYKIGAGANGNGLTWHINRANRDNNGTTEDQRHASSIILMEIAQ